MRDTFRYFEMAIGCLIFACAINTFFVPMHLLAGGVSGVAMIVYYLTGLPIGVQMLIYNAPLFWLGYKHLAREYLINAAIATGICSVFLDLTKFLSEYKIVMDPLLAAIFGGVFVGVGNGIIFRTRGSTGGMDIVAAIVKKYYSMNMGTITFGINCVIVSISAIFFGIVPAMYTLIALFVSANVIDGVVAGLNHRKVVIVISEQAEEIAEGIIREVGRGVTFLEAEGAFTRKHKRVIFVVAKLTQIANLKQIVDHYDKLAFMIVLSANEVMGRGFTIPGVEMSAMLEAREHGELETALKKQDRLILHSIEKER